jgi:hypothetical protein
MDHRAATLGPMVCCAAPGLAQLDDCDGDGQLDAVQIAADQALDRNRDGVLDACQEEWFGRVEVIATDLADPPDVTVADFDGDGLPDVAIAIRDEVSWRRNLGPGGFGLDRPLATRPCSTNSRQLIALDVGGDGDMDLVCWRTCESVLLENVGAGTFSPPVSLGGPWESVHVTDLDVDGYADLVVSTYLPAPGTDGALSWLQNGPGGLAAASLLTPTTRPANTITSTDLDGDLDPDILTAYSACILGIDWVERFENSSAGQIESSSVILSSTGVCIPYLQTGDMNGDGWSDVLLTGLFNPFRPELLLNQAGATFIRQQLDEGGTPTSDGLYNRHLLADFDLDGDLDLVSSEWSTLAQFRSENDGAGRFTSPRPSAPAFQANGYVTGFLDIAPPSDIDGDGGLDLLWTRRLEGPPLRWELGLRPNLVLDDCDGDGTTDRDQIARTPWMDGNGDGVLDRCEAVGGTYCTSSGGGASLLPSMVAVGSDAVEDGDLTLIARFLPQHSVGYFVASRTPGNTLPVPGSIGRLCVSGSIGRAVGGVLDSSTLGTLVAQVDLTAIPQPTGPVAVQPGETLHFQAWHRTTLAGQPTSDLTDAVRVTFE